MMFLNLISGLGAVRHTFAHDAGRPHGEHDDQHDEGEDVLVVTAEEAAGEVADVAGAQALDNAEHDAAYHGAVNVADAAQHGRREAFKPGTKPIANWIDA